MDDLTPETLAAWREDAENYDVFGDKPTGRILALLNGLEDAERKYADLVAAVRGLADEWGTRASENVGLTLRHMTELLALIEEDEK